jgi:Bacterial archaeo-eukaryotic release factor family 3
VKHGKGSPKDDYKTLLTEYLRTVIRHLRPVLAKESAPLVLAAVDYVHPIFQDLCSYPHLLPEGVNASPDSLVDSDLHRRALEIVTPKLHPRLASDRKHYEKLRTTDRIAFQIETVLPAAETGRIEALFAAQGAHVWGRANGDAAIQVHHNPQPGDRDLLDVAVAKTIANGGVVHIVDANDVPSHGPIAAILR